MKFLVCVRDLFLLDLGMVSGSLTKGPSRCESIKVSLPNGIESYNLFFLPQKSHQEI